MPISGSGTAMGGLGGAAGYGEIEMKRGDDNGLRLDVSAVFEDGFNFFGTQYGSQELFVNTNGTLSFGKAFSAYPQPNNENVEHDLIAAFWSDVDTRLDGEGAESGAIWIDIDPASDVVTITWENVGAYRRNADLTNLFQVQLFDRGSGDFDIVLRYERIEWTQGTGDMDDGARVKLGSDSLDASEWIYPYGSSENLLGLPTAVGNTGSQGLWVYELRDGTLPGLEIVDGISRIGTNQHDLIEGTSLDDRLTGLDGDDFLRGNAGNDYLSGGNGVDTLSGGDGDDSITGGETATDVRDVIYGGDGRDWIDAGYGNDLVYSGSGDDELKGNFGNDLLYGQMGDDILYGEGGNDTMYGGDGADKLFGGDGQDVILGTGGIDTLSGQAGRDWLDGGDGNDGIYGGADDDTLLGGTGNDTLNGGTGFDLADYQKSTDGVQVRLTETAAQFVSSGQGVDTLSGIEGLVGSSLDDRLFGNDVANHIFASDGEDIVYGGGGNDTMDGGTGTNDFLTYYYSSEAVTVSLQSQGKFQFVSASQGNDYVTNFESLLGSVSGDTLTGDGNRNVIQGYAGADRIAGANGNDYLNGGGSNDTVLGGEGDDIILGDNGDDWLVGHNGDDTLAGGAGHDTIYGSSGSDLITGGSGADLLYGGGQIDVFIYTDTNQSTFADRDIIADFSSGSDVIDLSGIDADTKTSGNQAFTYLGSVFFSGTEGQLNWATAGGNTWVRADTNGDGTLDFNLQLSGVTSLVASDFIL